MIGLRQLRQVRAICETGSFGKAATALGVSQPNLSKSIARLEDQLGVRLFERSSSAATPTVFALHLSTRSERLLLDASGLVREIELMAGGELGTVRIGLGAATRELAPEAVSRITSRFPQLELRIVVALGDELFDRLAGRDLDLVVVSAVHARRFPDGIVTPLFRDSILFFARPGHPLADVRELRLTDLYEYPQASASSMYLALRDPELIEQQIKIRRSMTCMDFGIIRLATQRSDTIASGPLFIFADDLRNGRLVALDVRHVVDYACVAATTPEAAHSAVVREVVQIFGRVGEELSEEPRAEAGSPDPAKSH